MSIPVYPESLSDANARQAEAIGRLSARVAVLEAALREARYALRAPLDGWKGDVERRALDADVRDAQRYRFLRERIQSSHATADGTHFYGDKITVDFPPPGRIYITDDIRKAIDTAIDAALSPLPAKEEK